MKQLLIILLVLTVFQASAQKKKKAIQTEATQATDSAITWQRIEQISDTTYRVETKRIFYEQDGLVHVDTATIISGVIGNTYPPHVCSMSPVDYDKNAPCASYHKPIYQPVMILVRGKEIPLSKLLKDL